MSEVEKQDVVKKEGKKLAVIRVRGLVRVNRKINATMNMMNLFKKNFCVLIDKKDLGMLRLKRRSTKT